MSDKIAEIRKRHEDVAWRYIELPVIYEDRATLLAEVERQVLHIDELRAKVDAEKSCACSYDAPGDICVAHSPALMQARAEVERLRAEILTLLRAEMVQVREDNAKLRLALKRTSDERNETVLAKDNQIEKLEGALVLISRNTCCGGCQEAARVARNALEGKP